METELPNRAHRDAPFASVPHNPFSMKPLQRADSARQPKNLQKNKTAETAGAIQAAANAERAARRWLLVFVALYIVLCGLLVVRVPLGRAPDETAHVYYVQHLAVTHSLPVFSADAASTAAYEFHQPPLYYAICALAWNAAGPGAQNYGCRLVSLLFGVGTIFLVFAAARRLFDARVATLASGFVALWPLHINVGATAGNDASTGFFCALIFYLLARGAAHQTPSPRLCVAIGIAIGLAILSKMSGLTVAVAAFGWVLHATWRGSKEQSAKEPGLKNGNATAVLRNGAIVFAVAALLCGPWLLRNNALYGDPLALGIFEQAFRDSPSRASAFFARGTSVSTYVRSIVIVTFCTMWGLFGGPNTALDTLAPPTGGGPLPVALPAVPVAFLCLTAMTFVTFGWARARPSTIEPQRRTALLWLLAGCSLVWLAWINFTFTYFQAQARYVHPALLPMALFAAAGWRLVLPPEKTAGKIAALSFGALLIALTLWNAFGWRTLI